ncbi:hypothetical protein [Limnospira platensis]|uniref:hypothetical protein n=1 Tax=Limnospira platensis TaxID=118562 RepID=UPI0001D0E6C7|nr:hypothetical protein APPUASWS_031000 [Arthrospira platensis str. Paraca]MDF2208086.1 hypothetical protein [Arthrospira platensis NCB002]WAK73840.1 hypothetical protein AP9108_23315 [Arthrospira sp. PCC 9108]BAI92636.1 hypothetical protein NIES39_L04790 [Arthrospira platensis NIES-39]BDT14898.1 hypothetical protein N39L_46210 [Arthrospira platensis NIES-39]
MNKLHYRGIFDITGELLSATYNPHLFEYEITQIAYRILTPIKEHKTQEILDLAYSYMGCYSPRGDYRGHATARLTNEGSLRVSIVGNPQFWDVCKKISKTINQSSKDS